MARFVARYAVIVFLVCFGHCEAGESEYFEKNFGRKIESECVLFLRLFANATEQFNWCLVQHAKPLRMCEKCTRQYSEVLRNNPVKFNDSHCVKDLVTSERFQVVMKVYDFQTGLWETAHCNKCYESKWNLTSQTTKFFQKLKDVQHCFENYTNLHKNDNSSSNVSVCRTCQNYYDSLRETYDKLLQDTTENKEEDQLCVDIMSMMNDTRQDWARLNCDKVEAKNYNVLSLTGALGLFTLIYYAGVRKHEKYKNKISTRSQRVKQIVNYDSE